MWHTDHKKQLIKFDRVDLMKSNRSWRVCRHRVAICHLKSNNFQYMITWPGTRMVYTSLACSSIKFYSEKKRNKHKHSEWRWWWLVFSVTQFYQHIGAGIKDVADDQITIIYLFVFDWSTATFAFTLWQIIKQQHQPCSNWCVQLNLKKYRKKTKERQTVVYCLNWNSNLCSIFFSIS